jgi:signal peptidase I
VTQGSAVDVDEPAPQPPTPWWRRPGGELFVLVATAIVLAVLLRTFVAQAFYIPSGSMVPQLEVGDRVVVSRLSYDLHDPNRGDVVVFDSPYPTDEDDSPLPVRVGHRVLEAVGLRQQSTEEFIKRVIGLPGETVEGRDGGVFVDGREVVEPYLPAGTETGEFAPVVVPDDSLFVMGDNRGNSQDSRVFGPIDADTVVGRAVVRVWPLDRAAFL